MGIATRGRARGRDLYNLGLSCSLYLSVNAVLILVISAAFVGESPLNVGWGLVTLSSLTTFVYIVDRLFVTDEDRINNPHRTALVERYRTALIGVATLAFVSFEVSVFAAAFSLDVSGILTVTLAHVPIVVLAVYDEIKTAGIPLDSSAVAFAWAYQIVYIFVFLAADPIGIGDSVVLFGCWFLIVFAGLEMRNVGDIDGDREAGKVTIACLLGGRVTNALGIGLKLTGVLVLTVVSWNPVVFGLLAVHMLSLRFYRTLETSFRYRSATLESAAV